MLASDYRNSSVLSTDVSRFSAPTMPPALVAMIRLVPLLVLLLVVPLEGQAQDETLEFHHLSGREGMSNFVWDILQDDNGIMWFATGAGLTRYDGYTVQTYEPSSVDSASISGQGRALLETSDGELLIGTTRGVDRLDLQSGTFERIGLIEGQHPDSLSTVVWALMQDDQGAVWVGTSGDGAFVLADGGRGRITQYAPDPNDPLALQHGDVQIFHQDRLGNIWIGTGGGGLSRFNSANRSFETYRREPGNPKSLGADSIYAVHEDRNGRLWIGTDGGGLCRFDPIVAGFDCVTRGARPGRALNDVTVQSIYEAADGRLWLGTASGGVNIFDPQTGEVALIQRDASNPGSISQDDVHRIVMDRFGTMWFSHHATGVSYTTPSEYRFQTVKPFEPIEENSEIYVSWVIEDLEPGATWFGSSSGIVRTDKQTGELEHFKPHPQGSAVITMENLNALHEGVLVDGRGRLWAGNFQGELFSFDPASRSFETHMLGDTLGGGGLHPAFIDRLDRMWIWTSRSGLARLDLEAGTLRSLPVPGISGAPAELRTAYAFMDNVGDIWVAGRFTTELGELDVFQYRWSTDDFVRVRRFDLSEIAEPGFKYFMSPGDPGVFWSSGSAGLLRVDASSGDVELFPASETGMPSSPRAVVFDDGGRLWYGNDGGVFGMFDPASRTGTEFFAEDGVEMRWFAGGIALPSGELRFAGIGGFVTFDPDRVLEGATPPDIRISRVGSGLSSSLVDPAGSDASFSHEAGPLVFEYIALHYADPMQNSYRYRLDGFETDWHVVGSQRTAVYAGLPPGRYTFSVQAASSQGVWSPEPATFSFRIRPPWWRTIPAYVAFFVVLGGSVVAVDRFQRRRLTRKSEEASRQRELEQARAIEKAYRELDDAHRSLKQTQGQLVQQEKMASLGQLTAGIAHEIKNPLNFVNNFADLNTELLADLEQALSEGGSVSDILVDLKSNAEQISKHGRRADDIVRSMMAHARGGEAQTEQVDLNDLVDEYVNLAFHSLRTKLPDFSPRIVQRLDPTAGNLTIVPQDIGRVLLNLLGNAFDAVRERSASEGESYLPTVRIETRRDANGVELRISDNGLGIPPDVLPRIFEPFYTTKPSGEGTGLGLSMSFDIVTQGHGGSLDAESTPGDGATFRMFLPVETGSRFSTEENT